MSNNDNNNPIANEPPVQDGAAAVPVRVSSDEAANNSSEYPESTEQEGRSLDHHGSSDDSGYKTAEPGDDHEDGDDDAGGRDAEASHSPPATSKKRNKTTDETNEREPTFPVKLHRILSNAEHEDIISWLPHGRSWRINMQKRFEEEVLPLYFKHGRYSSFARQVNGWGFKRVMQGSDYNSYYHEMFLRNLPALCERMRRLTTKDIANRKMDNSAVPDFYSLSREYPLPDATDGMPDEADHTPSSTVAAAGSSSAQTLPRTADQSNVTTSTSQAASRKAPAIPRNIQMQAELRMLEKRRKEIVDRIAFLAANLGQSTPSENNDPSPATASATYSRWSSLDANVFGGGGGYLGNPPASSQPCGDGIGALTQQGILALLHQPGGAQLLAQLAMGIQINRQNHTESQARIAAPPPPAFNHNPLQSMPDGFQLLQHLMSSNKSNQTSLQVNAPAPVAYTPPAPAPAPAMGEAQLIVERLMQAINNRTTTDSATMAPTPTLVSSPAQNTSQVPASHLALPTAVAPPPMAGFPAAILQMLSAAQQHQAPPPPTTMHASTMPQASNNGLGASAILQMLTAAMGNSNAAAATAPSAPPPVPPPPPQPLFVSSASTGQSTNNISNQNSSQQHPDAAAMMQQLLQNGNLDLASLMAMSRASLNPPDNNNTKRGN